ncbi:sugar ABC transporter ATP-binding protein [Goodfellowiella coeruleoviolacea]|uniref:Simple sugar transport system ATP-binding protein n=1 Tax=Goodfellowiella coeruleoviolacea TaxID=334858 RepID=A0AAE3GCR8_9PSEU|nr:sugar ABC transporter ATP-binding protein [Goodfellowiella coeruleoviolacea]MCP2164774.1 simple sugar transport system ATP-binding protein [Goodfellowiella coeruleoviolacea]
MSTATDLPPAAGVRLAVQAHGITKRYGRTVALNQAKISIVDGQTHGLVGRNGAGKSTLVSILTGLQAPDEGTVAFGGEPAPPLGDRDAWRGRVACVYQKSTIIPALTVAENLFINRQSLTGGSLINWGRMRRRAGDLLAEYGVLVDPARPAAELTVEQRQLVEIARALSFGARFIILDEPTAQLDAAAIDRLFARIRALQHAGVTFLFISHHLREVYEICQTVTVFRDARHILTSPVADLSQDRLVDAMTGEAVGLRQVADRPAVPDSAPAVLAVSGLGLADQFTDVDLTVRRGEVVGLAGSASSGKVAVGEAVVGLRRPDTGEVRVAGQLIRPGSVPHALAGGIGFVPEDRHREGLVPLLSVAENGTMTIADRFGRFGAIAPGRRRAAAQRFITDLAVKTDGPDQPVAGLSGGNQQKVVMARALANDPVVLVLINPTAGVDVRSKETLLDVVDQAAASGTAVVIVSDELDDLRPCDRVLVMSHGRVVRTVARGWTDNELVAAIEGMTAQSAGQPGGGSDAGSGGSPAGAADVNVDADVSADESSGENSGV